MHNGKHLYSAALPANELKGDCVCAKEREIKRWKRREKVENELTMHKCGGAFTPVSLLSNMWWEVAET